MMSGPAQTILVVEDEVIVQMLVVDFLTDLGYEILEANDAGSALPILRSERRIDLLVTDVGLPGMSGRELAAEARRHRPELKVLFATGYADDTSAPADLSGPGFEVVGKPFDLDRFARTVRSMLDAGPA